MRAIAYIDGFNLFYGCLKKTSYKWLDLQKLVSALYPNVQLEKIKYFTARIAARPTDPDAPTRQQMYLRALKTIPNLEIYFGHFLCHTVSMPEALPPHHPVKVLKTEEKGSDVNLASHMLFDGCKNAYEAAIFISNDSDLLCPIKMIRGDLGKKVFMINPHKNPSNVLRQNVDSIKPLREGVLRISQFAPQLQDKNGTFKRPASWPQ